MTGTRKLHSINSYLHQCLINGIEIDLDYDNWSNSQLQKKIKEMKK